MKRIIGCSAMVLSLAAFSPAFASNPYEEGLNAAWAGDYETAFEKWKPLVIEGNGDAMFELAQMYHAGLHVDQNEVIALQLYQMAAKNGNRTAQAYLAAGYDNGWFGLPRNEELAAYWLGKAEQGSDDLAAYQLGDANQ